MKKTIPRPRHVIINLLKTSDEENCQSSQREKIHHLQRKKEKRGNRLFVRNGPRQKTVYEKRNVQPSTLYPVKIAFKNEEVFGAFHDFPTLREFIASKFETKSNGIGSPWAGG